MFSSMFSQVIGKMSYNSVATAARTRALITTGDTRRQLTRIYQLFSNIPRGLAAHGAFAGLAAAVLVIFGRRVHFNRVYKPAFRKKYFEHWDSAHRRDKTAVDAAIALLVDDEYKTDIKRRELERHLSVLDALQKDTSEANAKALSLKLVEYRKIYEEAQSAAYSDEDWGSEGVDWFWEEYEEDKKDDSDDDSSDDDDQSEPAGYGGGPLDAEKGPHGGWMNEEDGNEYCGKPPNHKVFSDRNREEDEEWYCYTRDNRTFTWAKRKKASATRSSSEGSSSGHAGGGRGGGGGGGRGRGRGAQQPMSVDAIVDAFLARRLAQQQLKGDL